MHLDEEQVERLRHGELVPRVEAVVREHLEGCAACRARVAETEREEHEVDALLHHLDHTPPRVHAHAVAQRARSHGFRSQWAAGIVIAVGLGGASYAIPGSPFPGWVRAVARFVGSTETSDPIPSPPPELEPTPPFDPGVAGIAVAPGRALVVSFASLGGQIIVSLTDAADVVVRAPAGAATFASHVDRLRIENRDSATFEIQIPRNAPRVEIEVNGRAIFLKEGSRVTCAESADPRGRYHLPLTSTGP